MAMRRKHDGSITVGESGLAYYKGTVAAIEQLGEYFENRYRKELRAPKVHMLLTLAREHSGRREYGLARTYWRKAMQDAPLARWGLQREYWRVGLMANIPRVYDALRRQGPDRFQVGFAIAQGEHSALLSSSV